MKPCSCGCGYMIPAAALGDPDQHRSNELAQQSARRRKRAQQLAAEQRRRLLRKQSLELRRPIAAALKLARHRSRMTQDEAARASGVGTKSISAFETSARAGAIKLTQLTRLLSAYEMTLPEFLELMLGDEAQP